MADSKIKAVIGNDILEKFHDVPSVANDRYRELLPSVTKAVARSYESQRKAAKKIADIIFDGNISEDGISNNPHISEVQNKMNEIAMRLVDEYDLCKLDEKAVNAILSGALTAPEVEETYYQTVRLTADGKPISQKFRNIIFHPSYLFSVLKSSYLIGKTIVEGDVVTFVWTVLDFIRETWQATECEITPKQVTVLIYLAKYATNSISEEDLKEKVEKCTLDIRGFGNYSHTELTSDELPTILTQLSKMHIISINEGQISLIEKILL